MFFWVLLGPPVGPTIISMQYGPVTILEQSVQRHSGPLAVLVKVAQTHLLPASSAKKEALTLFYVSAVGASRLASDRDVVLLPVEADIVVLHQKMSDSLIASLLDALPSAACKVSIIEWIRANGGEMGPETQASLN